MMKNLELKGWDNETPATLNDVLNICPDNKKERLFLSRVIQLVRQEMMDEVVERVEHLSYFTNTEIRLNQ
jgi:hypothetical protein